MIITKETNVILNVSNISYYRELGYSIPDKPVGTIIVVPISHLSKGSNINVEVACDYCNSIKSVTFKEYNRNMKYNGKFSCSNKCGSIKKKEISIIKYGVESPSMLEKVKNKNKITNNLKYGKDYYMCTEEFKAKSEETMMCKYGTKQPMHSEELKRKLKETILNMYGVDNIFKSTDIKDKIRQYNIIKFGVDHYSKTNEFKEKIIKTSLKNWDSENHMSSVIFKEKLKKINLEKWGAESYMATGEFRRKSKEYFRSKWGVDSNTQSEEIRKINNENCKDPNYIKYIGNYISLYQCNMGHDFEISSNSYHSRVKNNTPLCTICNPIGDFQSIKENELFDFIKSIYTGEIIQSYRNQFEIDIYIPKMNIGFEFNGLYWHSEKYRDKSYHINKTNFFKERNIRIIHIWEDDWIYKKEIIKSQIKNILHNNSNKIYARKCIIKEVNIKNSRKFLNDNHIQGFVNSNLKLGLYYNDELVSLMTFDHYEGRQKMNNDEWNLNRFCTKKDSNVVGGASKLLNFFIKTYNPKRIISYADLVWSDGELYYKLGFDLIDITKSDYKYIVNGKRIHKSRYKKDRLTHVDKTLTESVIMKNLNINRVWDCGKMKFERLIVND